jgi:hypothetical protein
MRALPLFPIVIIIIVIIVIIITIRGSGTGAGHWPLHQREARRPG